MIMEIKTNKQTSRMISARVWIRVYECTLIVMYVTCASIKLSSFYQLMSTSVGVHLYLSPSGRPAFPPEPEPAPRSPGRGSTNKTAPLKCFAELHTGKKKNVNTGVLEYVHNKCSFNLIVPDVRVFFNLLNFRYYCDSAYVYSQSH